MSQVFSKKQKKVLALANHRWNILYGATRSGKTHVSYFLALQHIREHWNHSVLFCGKTLNTLDRNVFDPMRRIFGDEYIGDIVKNREINIFGKTCYCVGANDERAITKIQGTGLGYAYLDELTTYPDNFFQMLKSRLDAPNACCDATCNPESPSHFVKQFIDKTDVDVYAEHFTLYDNPFLTPDFVTALENEYRGTIYFEKWVLGNWVKAEGLVFPLFKRESHYLTPKEYASKFGRQRIRYVIFGVDGANTNDSTAIIPLAIMDNGQAVTLQMFYHDPKVNGQLSNEQLWPLMDNYFKDLESEYKFRQMGTQFYTTVDCAAADLKLTLEYHLPDYYNVDKFTHKDIMQTTDIVNNAFARGVLCILNFGGYYNYTRNQFIEGKNQLVTDLELMTWDKNNEKYDSSVPNDCADAFRYAVCTYFANPANIWETPDTNIRYKES
jgi:PBSX family phage terminase large subunit